MYHHIVMTTGVSLFAGRSVFGGWTRERDYFKFEQGRHNPYLHEGTTEEQVTKQWLQEAQEVFASASQDPENVSAEYTMLHVLRKQNKLSDQPNVILFHTETLGGRLAAKLMHKVIEHDFGATVRLHGVAIDVKNERVQLNSQIGDYMKKLSDALIWGDPTSTCFAPIGGYKVMTSFGYIVGAFHGYPTAYVQEEAQHRLHIIPPVPLDIPEVFFEAHVDFIRRLRKKDLIPYDDLNYHEQTVVDSYPALFDIDEGLVCFNPFGEFLFKREQYRTSLETKVYVSEAVLRLIDKHPSQKAYIYQQIRVLMEKARQDDISDRGILHHERDFADLKGRKLKYKLYKGASNGRSGVFRATWNYEEDDDILFINYLWLKKPYEEEVKQGRGLIKDEGSFTEITDVVYCQI